MTTTKLIFSNPSTRVGSDLPIAYRLVRRQWDGTLFLQGQFAWTEYSAGEVAGQWNTEWRDIPTVQEEDL